MCEKETSIFVGEFHRENQVAKFMDADADSISARNIGYTKTGSK